jgi:hypothetical protein
MSYLRTGFTTASGKFVNLREPCAAQIVIADMAEGLSKLARYSGATPYTAYSVAQHSALGSDAILRATGDRRLAAYFLIHDGHEYLIGDDNTPKKMSLIEIARERHGDLGALIVEETMRDQVERLDLAIHTAAGLAYPLPPEMAVQVHHWDLVMRDTEWRDLMRTPPPWPRDPAIVPLAEPIDPWRAHETGRSALLHRCFKLLPALQVPGVQGGIAREDGRERPGVSA